MCKCTPSIRTPFCGKPGCQWPKPDLDKLLTEIEGQPEEKLPDPMAGTSINILEITIKLQINEEVFIRNPEVAKLHLQQQLENEFHKLRSRYRGGVMY